jgi:hypothetical protein
MRTTLFAFFCTILMTASIPSIGQQSSPQRIFLSLSDLHFNPFAFPGLTDTLLKSPVKSWAAIYRTAANQNGFGNYGDDTNFNLFLSTLNKIKATTPHPDFIVLTGDFLSHNFGTTFQTNTGIYNPDTLFLFIHKTLQFTTEMLQHTFPGTTIFPVLGNNDSYCGDYQGEVNDRFFQQVADCWYPLVKKTVSEQSFKQTFLQGGFYAAHNPIDSNHIIIALNSIVYSVSYDSPKYPNYCNGSAPDSIGLQQMAWLKSQLQQCRTKKKKVWLLYHIPPGINSYSTASASNGSIVTFWQEKYSQPFIELVNAYKDVIQLNMAGHTHMDSFELFQDSLGNPYNFIHISPSISPIFGNNPSFEVISYLKGSATWKDFTCYYFNNFSTWNKEYSFDKTYGQPAITAKTLKQALNRILTDSSIRSKYIRYYNVSNTTSPGITTQTFPTFACSISAMSARQFTACYQNQ